MNFIAFLCSGVYLTFMFLGVLLTPFCYIYVHFWFVSFHFVTSSNKPTFNEVL